MTEIREPHYTENVQDHLQQVQHLLEQSGSVRFAGIHCFAALSSHRPAPSGGEYGSKSVRGMDAALEPTGMYSRRLCDRYSPPGDAVNSAPGILSRVDEEHTGVPSW